MNDVLNCTQEVTSFFLLSVMTFSRSNTSNSQTRLIVTAAKKTKGRKAAAFENTRRAQRPQFPALLHLRLETLSFACTSRSSLLL